MKAKITKSGTFNARQPDKKETVRTLPAVVYYKGELLEPVTARWYMGRSNSASVVYCNVWIRAQGKECSGRGSAGGWGYHKESAAFQYALDSAGVELYGSPYGRDEGRNKRAYIDGVGDSAIRMAVEAIVRALGFRGKIKIVEG